MNMQDEQKELIEKLNESATPEEWRSIVEDAGGSLSFRCDGRNVPDIPDWAVEADAGFHLDDREQHTNEGDLRAAFVPITIEFAGVTLATGAWITIDSRGDVRDWEDDLYTPGYPSNWTPLGERARKAWLRDKEEAIAGAF